MNRITKLLLALLVLCSCSAWAQILDLGGGGLEKVLVVAHKSPTSDSVANNATIVATYTVEIVDSHNSYDGIASFTCPIPGGYRVALQDLFVNPSADTKSMFIILNKNGSAIKSTRVSLTNVSVKTYTEFSREFYVELEKDDVISLSVQNNSVGATVTFGGDQSATAVNLGPTLLKIERIR